MRPLRQRSIKRHGSIVLVACTVFIVMTVTSYLKSDWMEIFDNEVIYENKLSTNSKPEKKFRSKDREKKANKVAIDSEMGTKDKPDDKGKEKASSNISYEIKKKNHKESLDDSPKNTEKDKKPPNSEKIASPQKGSSGTFSSHSIPFNTTDVDASCLMPNTNVKFKSGSLPKPILNMGFPDPGNKKLKEFFQCGGLDSNHQICTNKRTDIQSGKYFRYCGACIRDAVIDGLPPLKSCGDYDVFTHLSVEQPPDMCYWPQVEALDEIHKEYPDATFLLTFRNVDKWIKN